ncbi:MULTISPECIES: hypothetical protein [Arthrobacter]|uniref:Acid stress chaperone HdeA n=1 Tax=Arthrobacter terricola TaxID=2547396 RepID=A0A4R5KCI4_9MICC|nr:MULTISPECIES: hypothetical protein [Arthrobacter]MBT8162578.1 hypothetical protein [Arthrobacter sp. GN70]TDF92866.1 hypothetical protein E1809_17040 [Arthrobacter terricola]
MGNLKKTALATVVVVLTALSLTACSANQGANTKCSDYNRMSTDDQTKVIQQILKDKGQSESVLKIGAYKLSAKAYCALQGSDSTLAGL